MNPSSKLNANVFGEDAADEELYDMVDREIQPLERFTPNSVTTAETVPESLEGENQGNSCERGKKNLPGKQQETVLESSSIGHSYPRNCLGGRSHSQSPSRYDSSRGAPIRLHKINKTEGSPNSDWASSRKRLPSDHILHCLTIREIESNLGRAGVDTRLEHIEVTSQAQFDEVHGSSAEGVNPNQLRIYIGNWCTEWMHDSLVRETNIPESFFTAWRHEWFQASANISRLSSRGISGNQEETRVFVDYPHLHIQNYHTDTLPLPPNVLRYSPGSYKTYNFGCNRDKPGFERWGFQRLCVWVSPQGPNMSMVIFMDKPPQWFNVDQPDDTVDVYSYIFQLLNQDSLRCHTVNEPIWLVSELLRESARWHNFGSYARRHWDHCVSRSLSIPGNKAIQDLHAQYEEFSDCLQVVVSHLGLVNQLQAISSIDAKNGSISISDVKTDPSRNLSILLEQLYTCRDTLIALREQVRDHIRMIQDSIQAQREIISGSSSTTTLPEDQTSASQTKATPHEKRKAGGKWKKKKLRRRAKIALGIALFTFFTNMANFEAMGMLLHIGTAVLFFFVAFRPRKVGHGLAKLRTKLEELDHWYQQLDNNTQDSHPPATSQNQTAHFSPSPPPPAPLRAPVMMDTGVRPPPLMRNAYLRSLGTGLHEDVPPGYATVQYIDRPSGMRSSAFDRHLTKYTRDDDGRIRKFNGDTVMLREIQRRESF